VQSQREHGWVRELLCSLGRFSVVGTSTTALYALLYVLAAQLLPTLAANLAAMVFSTIVSTEWHRRWTFRSPRSGLRMHLEAGLVTTVTYAMTSTALLVLEAVDPGAGRLPQVAAIVSATAVAGLVRYTALRLWVFAGRRQQVPVGSSELDSRYRPGVSTVTRTHAPSALAQPAGPSSVNHRLCRTRTSTSPGAVVSNVTPVGSELTSRPGDATRDVELTTS
jgi:putative flippase GtrA